MKSFSPMLAVTLAFTATIAPCAFTATAAAQQPAEDSGAAAVPSNADTEPARAPIEKLHTVILDAMKNADSLGYEGRRARLQPVIEQTFDLPFMAEKSAGRSWSDFTDEQKRRWVDTFSQMTIANYAGRFKGYSGQRFETLGTEGAGLDTLLVRTRLVQPNKKEEDVDINYRMHENGGTWKIVDIYLSGTVSELALRRAEYASVLQRDGFDKLVKDLEQKIADLRAGKTND